MEGQKLWPAIYLAKNRAIYRKRNQNRLNMRSPSKLLGLLLPLTNQALRIGLSQAFLFTKSR
ncbi:MAG: hypothetical protein IJT59_01750 [Desulfovibrionaceae bacterium]|nr:hypothetical protein [Desulfovibrionaceae bacterium]